MKRIIVFILVILTMIAGILPAYAKLEDSAALSISLVNQDPDPAVAGESVVQRAGTIQGYQGRYDPGNMKIVKFKIRIDKDTKAGSYELKIKSYEEGSTTTTQKSLSIDIGKIG